MQHDWNFYEAQVAARLTKGFLYRITELVNFPSSRQKKFSLLVLQIDTVFPLIQITRWQQLPHSSSWRFRCFTSMLKTMRIEETWWNLSSVDCVDVFLMEEVITISVNQVNDHFIFFFFFGIKSSIHLLLHSFNHSIIGLILLLLYRILEGSTVREKRLEILAFRRQDLV